jgi:NADH-quinone oxidoreductase subunit L
MWADDTYLCGLALIILICPLVGFILQAFFGNKLPRQGDWLPTVMMFVPLCIASFMMVTMLGSDAGVVAQKYVPEIGQNWMSSGSSKFAGALSISFGISVDNLTIVMLFVVTLVSFLVHLYSCGYMHGEVRYTRFFAYLGLFSFSMLGLCMTSNLLFLFMFWELVGLCSYFLIGFYFEKKSAQRASIKAFMTTRIGDLGFLIAILVIASVAGTLDIDGIFQSVKDGNWSGQAGIWGMSLLTVAGLCLFIGPLGKSAQFPLHIWLPDAMEGPTPVSALIHAATMVVAGIYLVGRMFPFLAGEGYFSGDFFSSDVLFFIALIGGFTALFAGSIAFAQTDIKKVLAYSTISQLGYMFLGLGVGSVSAGIFHLFTHAFFKALLFLGSGSVIHAVHSNEMKDMGGLRKKLPITWITFLIGTLAIAGLPLLSGFFSKEAILGNALAFAKHREAEGAGGFIYYLPFVFGIVTAGMTAFYMFRLYFKTFEGKPKNAEAYAHAHESPWTMTVPLCILAVLSLFSAGFFGLGSDWFSNRVNSQVLTPFGDAFVETKETAYMLVADHLHDVHYVVMGASIAMFLAGVGLAAVFFAPKGPFYGREVIRPGLWPLWQIQVCLQRLWFVDEFLTWLSLRTLHIAHVVCGYFDRVVIDGFVNFMGSICRFATAATGTVDYWGVDGAVRGIGNLTLRGGRRLRRLQTGFLQEYLYSSLLLSAGVVAVLLALFWLLQRETWYQHWYPQ